LYIKVIAGLAGIQKTDIGDGKICCRNLLWNQGLVLVITSKIFLLLLLENQK